MKKQISKTVECEKIFSISLKQLFEDIIPSKMLMKTLTVASFGKYRIACLTKVRYKISNLWQCGRVFTNGLGDWGSVSG